MGMLKIVRLVYSGKKYYYESPTFPDGLTIIEGPNGVGKSTFFNLIYFGLGGKVNEFEERGNELHAEIHGDSHNFVQLFVKAGDAEYSLIRKFRENSITVLHQNDIDQNSTNSLVFPIYRNSAPAQIFSDWLLEKLGIPVVEIYQAGKNFKLNFSELARLIYHNQAPDPHGIFKPADNSNFLTDSLEIRRAIFQILVGKTLLALYEAIGTFKRKEREYDAARGIAREYEVVVDEILKNLGFKEKRNVEFLSKKIKETEEDLESFFKVRKAYLDTPFSPAEQMVQIDADKRELVIMEEYIRENKDKVNRLIRESARVYDVQQKVGEDIARVSKVIHADKQLKLFSSDTCPYCLNVVSRVEAHCVCGSPVDENDYQRFFYDQSEYVDILRSKIKSLETVRAAAQTISYELAEVRMAIVACEAKAESIRKKIDAVYAESGVTKRDLRREELDEKIFELKNILHELEQAFTMESKLNTFNKKVVLAKSQREFAEQEMRKLDAASRIELQSRLEVFNDRYDHFLTTVLAECRSANIDSETYLPVVNSGVYREASAEVPKRFLYYLTLLQMSLIEEIPFPRLLLIDTPETSGIDKDNLVRMMRQIDELDKTGKRYQILMASGESKYPPEYEDKVLIRLSHSGKLLKARDDFTNRDRIFTP